MFLHVSVILSTWGVCSQGGCAWSQWGLLPGGTWSRRELEGRGDLLRGVCLVLGGAWWRPPGRLLLRAVRILLECILVSYIFKGLKNIISPVEDPGFPPGGGANSPGGCQHTILPRFPKNCMKLKEFGPPGVRTSKILLCRSATAHMSCATILGSFLWYTLKSKYIIISFIEVFC